MTGWAAIGEAAIGADSTPSAAPVDNIWMFDPAIFDPAPIYDTGPGAESGSGIGGWDGHNPYYLLREKEREKEARLEAKRIADHLAELEEEKLLLEEKIRLEIANRKELKRLQQELMNIEWLIVQEIAAAELNRKKLAVIRNNQALLVLMMACPLNNISI